VTDSFTSLKDNSVATFKVGQVILKSSRGAEGLYVALMCIYMCCKLKAIYEAQYIITPVTRPLLV